VSAAAVGAAIANSATTTISASAHRLLIRLTPHFGRRQLRARSQLNSKSVRCPDRHSERRPVRKTNVRKRQAVEMAASAGSPAPPGSRCATPDPGSRHGEWAVRNAMPMTNRNAHANASGRAADQLLDNLGGEKEARGDPHARSRRTRLPRPLARRIPTGRPARRRSTSRATASRQLSPVVGRADREEVAERDLGRPCPNMPDRRSSERRVLAGLSRLLGTWATLRRRPGRRPPPRPGSRSLR
jgi:hypothetical protein